MDCDVDTLTRLLLDPCLTTGEAEREAAAVCGRELPTAERPHLHEDVAGRAVAG